MGIAFGEYILDVDTRELVRGSPLAAVHLSPKAFDLLRVLLEARPKAMAKQTLHEQLWPDTFVSESTLASLVSELRQALDDRDREPRFIRTVHGFGYAFCGAAQSSSAVPSSIAGWIVLDGREFALGPGDHLIGRDVSSSIVLESPSVSRRHARVVVGHKGVVIEDLGSKNGTALNGAKIVERVELVNGDRIQVGSFLLSFRAAAGTTLTLSPCR